MKNNKDLNWQKIKKILYYLKIKYFFYRFLENTKTLSYYINFFLNKKVFTLPLRCSLK